MTQPTQRREMVQQVQAQHPLSQRRVCQALGFDRSSIRYEQSVTKQEQDRTLTKRLQTLAQEHPRFGYRRMEAMLQRQNQKATHKINHKRVQRLWHQAGLSLPRRRPKKRTAVASTTAVNRAIRPNQNGPTKSGVTILSLMSAPTAPF